MKLPLVTPIYKDTVYTWTYSSGLVNQTGMIYIDNLEYQITSGMLQSLYLLRMHNPEGYADNVTINPYGPFYYYYHKDHLGNNREVWKAAYSINGTEPPAAVVQQTSYYPSGLPWSDGSGVSAQPYKYNGKEFVEMHGYDTYDYGARGYYPAMGRFMTVDPLAEKYYSISSYAYCAGNPVIYIDPNGKEKILAVTGDKDIKRLADSYKDEKKVINIWAHGDSKGFTAMYQNGKTKDITNAKDFSKFLNDNSSIWREKGKDEKVTIVLHSCSTGKEDEGQNSFARQMSKDLENTTIIAPNQDIQVDEVEKENDKSVKTTELKEDVRDENGDEGKWIKYKGGELKTTYDSDSKPGSVGF